MEKVTSKKSADFRYEYQFPHYKEYTTVIRNTYNQIAEDLKSDPNLVVKLKLTDGRFGLLGLVSPYEMANLYSCSGYEWCTSGDLFGNNAYTSMGTFYPDDDRHQKQMFVSGAIGSILRLIPVIGGVTSGTASIIVRSLTGIRAIKFRIILPNLTPE